MKNKEIILGITASIAIYKSCDILRSLKEDEFNVTVVMTPEAKELISPLVFSTLSGNEVYSELFSKSDNFHIEHISLAKKADLLLIAPATANIIAKIACGICDDLLSCVALATRAKVLIAPAMNENMYKNRITQANIKKLKSLGFKFVGPIKGRLASGQVGMGCLAEVKEIVRAAKRYL